MIKITYKRETPIDLDIGFCCLPFHWYVNAPLDMEERNAITEFKSSTKETGKEKTQFYRCDHSQLDGREQ